MGFRVAAYTYDQKNDQPSTIKGSNSTKGVAHTLKRPAKYQMMSNGTSNRTGNYHRHTEVNYS